MFEALLFVLAVAALIYAYVIEGRRLAEADSASKRFAALERQMELLRRELDSVSARADTSQASAPAASAAAAEKQPEASAASFCQRCGANLPAAAQFCIRCGAAVPAAVTATLPEIKIIPDAEAVQSVLRPPAYVRPKPPALQQKPAAPAAPPAEPTKPEPVKPATVTPPPPPPKTPVVTHPATPLAQAKVTPPQAPAAQHPESHVEGISGSRFTSPPKSARASLEERLGLRWGPVVGISILVIGVGFLVGTAWGNFPHWLRATILYLSGAALLFGGIYLERDGRFKALGRSLIGGGWAVLALVTYAIANVSWLLLLESRNIDLFLLLGVIGAMVWHTLKYESQVVTGAGFLLGFVAIGMNPSAPYNLIAGAMLIAGMIVIVLRHRWFELEVFGILAAYVNHFYWLYRVYEEQGQRAVFPHHAASVAVVIGYWTIFRVSYLLRKVSRREQELVSTIAGILNPLLFLAVMKYQGFHPEWAWKVLLVMGAVEFTLGQIPVSRRRAEPFRLLSSLGAALMVAAIPFRYSGNSLELIWLAGAEVFLLAGIFQRERLFRGFGIIISFLIAGHAVLFRIPLLAERVFNAQPHHDPQLSLMLVVIAGMLYANAHVICGRWPELFREELDAQALNVLSFVASLLSVAAAYAYVPDHAVAVVLAIFVAWLCVTGKLFSIEILIYQAHWVACVVFVQVIAVDRDLTTRVIGLPERVLAFGSVAALLYLSSRFVRLSESAGKALFYAVYAWGATSLIALLIWFQLPVRSVAMGWMALALVLSFAGQKLKRDDLKWQSFAMVLLSFARGVVVNMNLTATFPHFTYRLLSVSLIAAAIYFLARWAPVKTIRPVYSVAGTILFGYLAFKETENAAVWTAVAWIVLALALAVGSRLWKDTALLWQTHLLGAMSFAWALYSNFDPQYRATRLQLLTVAIIVAGFYALTWITNIADIIVTENIAHAYAWAGSLLLSWLIWYQFDPIFVSLVWGVFGVLLYELPDLFGAINIDLNPARASWHGQSYVALLGSFVHIFYANLNTRAEGGFVQVLFDRRVLTVWPLAALYFYIYWRVLSERPALTARKAVSS